MKKFLKKLKDFLEAGYRISGAIPDLVDTIGKTPCCFSHICGTKYTARPATVKLKTPHGNFYLCDDHNPANPRGKWQKWVQSHFETRYNLSPKDCKLEPI